jgi:hypothetical protein
VALYNAMEPFITTFNISIALGTMVWDLVWALPLDYMIAMALMGLSFAESLKHTFLISLQSGEVSRA